MALIWEIGMAALCVLGMALVLWLLFGWLVAPVPRGPLWVVLQGEGDGGQLEHTLIGLSWLHSMGLFQGEVVLYDHSLTPEGRELALHLALRWPWVSCCPRGSLEEWITHREP